MVIKLAVDEVDSRKGYFYFVIGPRKDDLWDWESEPEPIPIESVEPQDEDGDDILNFRSFQPNCYYWRSCGHSYYNEFQVRPYIEYVHTREVGNVSWYNGRGMVCKKDLAIRLLTSNLLGIVVQRPDIGSPGGYPKPKDWYLVSGGGPDALKLPKMTPEPYKCWNCKNEPVCSVCGDMPAICPHCEAEYNIPLALWDGKNDKLLVYDPPPRIIDVKEWDGSDMFGSMITHRMLQFLLSCHAHPFRAVPMPVDVKDASDEDWERLEIARTPLSEISL